MRTSVALQFTEPARALSAGALKLDRALSDLLNQTCSLIPAEIDLMRTTASLRLPIAPPAT